MRRVLFKRLCLLVSLTFGALLGCATRMEMGAPPRVDRLEQLRPSISTQNDVLLLLGEPRGYGEARLDQNFPHQRVWYYEHIVTEGSKIETSMLLVFFTDDRYDGYMWFADAIQSKSQPAADRR